MKPITAPITATSTPDVVGNLQDAILFMLQLPVIEMSEADRRGIHAGVEGERPRATLGRATMKAVNVLQERLDLTHTADVDEATADAFNRILRAAGAFEEGAVRNFIVIGTVRSGDGLPCENAEVRAFHETATGRIRLGEDTTDTNGHYTIRYESLPDVPVIALRVIATRDGLTVASSNVGRGAKAVETMDLTASVTVPTVTRRRIEGRVVFEHGAPAEGLKLRLNRYDFGKDAATLVQEVTTGEQGLYKFEYDADPKSNSLEIAALDAAGKEVKLTAVMHGLGAEEVAFLNLAAPDNLQPLQSEFARMSADFAPHFSDMKALADARENKERQDLTLLNAATGWDARLVALASKAARVSQDPDVGLSQAALYGLFRTGLPSDTAQLAQVSAETVGQALEKVQKAGIAALSDQDVRDAKGQFAALQNKARLSATVPGTQSSYGSLLTAAELTAGAQEKFAAVYLNHTGSPDELWTRAAAAGVGSGDIEKLQQQGKLAFLTRSEAMTTHLQKTLAVTDPVQLVDKGLYKASTWKAEAEAIAAGDAEKLKALIPPSYGAATADEGLKLYTEDMARKVRVSYPTQVLAHQIEQDAADIFQLGAVKHETATLLKDAAAKGFRLGQTPVDAFMKTNADIVERVGPAKAAAAVGAVRTLQRIYQMTPSDAAMPVLLKLGFTSAFDVVALPQNVFLERHGDAFTSLEEATLVYRKAQQVSSVTHNLFTIARKLQSDAPLYGISGQAVRRDSAKHELIKQFPTMESLFGSMDYGECEHCRSVLSPAAYFVDLLQFIDSDAVVWNSFLSDWKKRRGGEDYTSRYKKPYDALIERRPDLPHIALTCENTHTALPYIDIANEILEYYVAHGALESKAANNTSDDSTTAELLAEPQHVIAEAYEKLHGTTYPLNLPFDLWLETVRSFADYFETPLTQILETFRTGDELFVSGAGYDGAAIAFESLGLSPAETALFINPDPLSAWHELYGFPSEAAALTEAIDTTTGQRTDLHSAKALSRRLGITYKELVKILQTDFVNPDLDGLATLHKLRLTVHDVLFYTRNKELYETNKDLLAVDRHALSADDQARLDALSRQEFEAVSEVAGFEQRLKALTDEYAHLSFDAAEWVKAALDDKAFENVLLLADPNASSDFDRATLVYGFRTDDKRAADALAFTRINLFVRLWRKLGWTIEETDRALRVFVPRDEPFAPATIARSPLKSALINLARFKALDARLGPGSQGRLRLLSLWSTLATSGARPLYAQLFLQPGRDAIFNDPLGRFLSTESVTASAEARTHRVFLEDVPTANEISAAALAGHARVRVSYDRVQLVQHLEYDGTLTDADKASLAPLSASPAWPELLDAVQRRAREFVLLEGHLPAVMGALGLTADEIDAVLADAGQSLETAPLSLENVSLVYRYGLLAKALQMSVSELITLKALSGLNPFHALHSTSITRLDEDHLATQTLKFVDIADRVRDSGFRISDLDYLLRHRFDPTGRYRPDTAATSALLENVADGIGAIHSEQALPEDRGAVTDDVLRQKLGLAVPPEVADRVVRALNGKATDAERAVVESGVKEHAVQEDGAGVLDDADLKALFAPLAAGEGEATLQDRRHRLLEVFLPVIRGRLTKELVAQALSAHLAADRSLVEALVTDGKLVMLGEGANAESLLDALRGGGDPALAAVTLLRKVLHLLQTLNLREREVRYILAHPADFDGLSLSRLPTSDQEDARALFAQVLRLIAYARLAREMARGSQGLIDVFEAKNDADAYAAIGALSRRESATVKAVARALGLVPPFKDERPLARLSAALAIVERLGVPVTSIVSWTRIVSPRVSPRQRASIAHELKEAIKARFEPETWQRVAQPIFDSLRQRKRDALVAHVMHQHRFARLEQVYEYFLIDPGMEPVVQTSRIRLATSSVQLFIQRSLLNLEKDVHASAINAEPWQWMKAYRVWEANRKIFLYPENWLEPEFRDDKTHLFRELEGNLLQGDVSSDLVEDAMLQYLRRLNELARLEIVAMHLEDRTDAALNTLHVIGRTYGEPHKYFYRRYAQQMWTPWEPITADISGDHLAPVIWKDRLFLFWTTFMEVPPRTAPPAAEGRGGIKVMGMGNIERRVGQTVLAAGPEGMKKAAPPEPALTEMTLSQLSNGVQSAVSSRINIQVQLHWSEYVKGEWSTRESGGLGSSFVVDVPFGFTPQAVPVHVSKDREADEDRAVYIHLGGHVGRAFKLAGRNSAPVSIPAGAPPANPYSAREVRATRFAGTVKLDVTLAERITVTDGKAASAPKTLTVLESKDPFTVLACDNDISFGSAEIASLVKPLFFQDTSDAYYLEPNVEEQTIEQWKDYVVRTPQPEIGGSVSNWPDPVRYVPELPNIRKPLVLDPASPIWAREIANADKFHVKTGEDWIVNPSIGMLFDGKVIGAKGVATGVSVVSRVDAVHAIEQGATRIAVQAGNELPGGAEVLQLRQPDKPGGAVTEAITIVGAGGMNQVVQQNVGRIGRLGIRNTVNGVTRINR